MIVFYCFINKLLIKDIIIISCYFGEKDTRVFKAPLKSKCYYFSNNKSLKGKIEAKGWNFIFLDNFELTKDYRISSLQSKYVKFLQFDKKKIKWQKGESILYFDNKLNVHSRHIAKAKKLCKNAILIRNTPKEKLTIDDEINEAIKQERYLEFMDKTTSWVENKIKYENYKRNNRIMNTGFILYQDVSLIQKLCDEVYESCNQLGQPECQVIWGVLSQRFEKNITRVNFEAFEFNKQNQYLKYFIKRVLYFIKRVLYYFRIFLKF